MRGQALQHFQQVAGIAVHRPHRESLEYAGEDALQHLAILQHVGDAGGHAQVVLQHIVFAVAIAHQVRAGDMAPDAPGRIQPVTLLPVRDRRRDHLGGNRAVLENFLVVVDVVDEGVERVDALLQAAFDAVPFVGRHDARDQVEGKDSFRARRVAVDVERDAELQQQPLGGMLIAQQLAVGERLYDLLHQLKVRPRRTVLLEHLVVKAFGLVCRKLHSPVRNPRR